MKLVYKDTGRDVPPGATVTLDGTVGKVTDFSPPKHSNSSGRVYVMWHRAPHSREYFPHVFGMKIIEE
jgi:hypothetical protein